MHIAGQTSVTMVTVLREMPPLAGPSIENQNPVFTVNEAERGRGGIRLLEDFDTQPCTFQTGRTKLNPRGPQQVILVTES